MGEPLPTKKRLRARRIAGALWLALLLASCTRPQNNGLGPLGDDETALPGIRYEVVLQGPLDNELREALEAASSTIQRLDQPPPDELALRQRAERDLPALDAALRGLGYYKGSIRVRLETIERAPAGIGADLEDILTLPGSTLRVVFEVEPGPRYRLRERRIEIIGAPYGFAPPRPAQLGLQGDAPAIAATVLEAETRLIRLAQERGHAFARAGPRAVIVDHDREIMDVTLRIEPGPLVRYGAIRFEGASGISERYLRRLVPAREGSRFDLRELERGRDALVRSGLFSVVRLRLPAAPEPDDRVSPVFELVQRKHRSIGGGVGYASDEGANLRAYWEHRNLFSAGERLRSELLLSPIRQNAQANFRKPEVGARGQALLASALAQNESLEAFDSRSLKLASGIERTLAQGLEGTLGLSWRFADIEDRKGRRRFALFSVPARLAWDGSDSLFDPSRGARLTFELAPNFDTLGSGARFLKSRVVASGYYPIWNRPRLVLAGRAATGTIVGAERTAIPADERWYAGGGGSVRGVPYQKAGPLDRRGDPEGGRSFIELSGEFRLGLSETLGLVVFVDGGSAFDAPLPGQGGLRWGTGLGLRYATPVGPLRLDVAVPIDRKPAVDELFQLYISLGQAF